MNPKWFGDSYDIVKRFFIEIMRDAGFQVFANPMFTGEWLNDNKKFLSFIGASHFSGFQSRKKDSALFIDPDTGVAKRATSKHCGFDQLLHYAKTFEIVFAFDQSFSRAESAECQITKKLKEIKELGGSGFYYNSHARFLFLSQTEISLSRARAAILGSGLPVFRLVDK